MNPADKCKHCGCERKWHNQFTWKCTILTCSQKDKCPGFDL